MQEKYKWEALRQAQDSVDYVIVTDGVRGYSATVKFLGDSKVELQWYYDTPTTPLTAAIAKVITFLTAIILPQLLSCALLDVSLRAAEPSTSATWPGFHGERADGHVASFPTGSFHPRLLWHQPLPSQVIGGVAATAEFAIASGRSADDRSDLFVCFDPISGAELWRLEYVATGQLDDGPSPRATPVIRDPDVFLLGTFGDLRCVDVDSGQIRWRKHLVRELGGELPIWRYGWSPLPNKFYYSF